MENELEKKIAGIEEIAEWFNQHIGECTHDSCVMWYERPNEKEYWLKLMLLKHLSGDLKQYFSSLSEKAGKSEYLKKEIDDEIDYLAKEIVVPITGNPTTPYEFNAIAKYKGELGLFADHLLARLLPVIKELEAELQTIGQGWAEDFLTYTKAMEAEKEAAVKEITKAYDEYINVLSDELSDMGGIAYVHGWQSKNIEKGKECRDKIESLKSKYLKDWQALKEG